MRLKPLVALLVGLSVSSSPYAADLLQVYRDALSNDAAYASARAAWTASREKLPQGRALLLPGVSFGANTTYNDREINFRSGAPSAAGQFNSNGYNVSVTQPLYRKQNFVQYEQAKTQLTQGDVQLQLAQQDLALRVAQAYFDVLLAEDNVSLAGAQKEAISQQLAQAKRNFEVGTATITDTHEAQARHDLITAQQIAARNDLEIKRRALQQIVGKLPDSLAGLKQDYGIRPPEPNDMNFWVDEAQRTHLQVGFQEATLEFATQEVERNRAGHHPTLDAVASYVESGSGSGLLGGAGTDTTSKAIGLQLSLPLYQGGATESRVREAVANREKALQDLENARRNAALAARQAFLSLTNGVSQVNALQQAVVSSQSSLDSTTLGRDVGVRTSVDVLNAQQQLYSARRDLAQARYSALLNDLRLKAAVGKLAEEDLGRVNQGLEASR